MRDIIVIIVSSVISFGAIIGVWWYENGPDKGKKPEEKKNTQEDGGKGQVQL